MHKLLLRVLFFTLLAVTLALVLPSLVAQAEPPIQGGPPQIPHAKEGHTDCLSCHAQGLNGAPKYPPDHTGRTNDMCLGCHQFKPGTPAVGAGTPVPTATAPAPVIIPTRVPHLAGTPGQDSCVDCHLAQGGASADIVKHRLSRRRFEQKDEGRSDGGIRRIRRRSKGHRDPRAVRKLPRAR